MMEDAVYLLLAGGLIALAILAYTRSIFLTLTTLTSILYTLSLAYFFYTFVFGVAFFPFMNVLATVIAIGKFPEVRPIFLIQMILYGLYKSLVHQFLILIYTMCKVWNCIL